MRWGEPARTRCAHLPVATLDVPAQLITTERVESDWAGYVDDHDPARRLMPAEAALNRGVVADFQ